MSKTKQLFLSTLSALMVGCGPSETGQSDAPAQAEVETPTAAPSMPLEAAAFVGNVPAIKQHIADGTDLNEKRAADGNTALITAATFGNTSAVKTLIEGGADVNLANNEGSTPLMIAAFLCREQVVEVLLDAGASKSLRNNAGATALESLQAPWDAVKPIYAFLDNALAPAGVSLDFEQIKANRPKIATLLE